MGDELMRWVNEACLPKDVRAAMRDFLIEAMRKAARKEDPGDGSMIMLSGHKTIGAGMWDGGWMLQASFVEDERMNPAPFVVVHAYQGSQFTKGSVASDIVRTAEDRRFIATKRLADMVCCRDQLNKEIDKLQSELA